MSTTPRSKRKRPPPNSPGDSDATICPICLDPIIDATKDAEGQEAIYCDATPGFTGSVPVSHKHFIKSTKMEMIHSTVPTVA